VFSFNEFALDVARRELSAGGVAVPVEPQVFDLLVFLIENRDRVVSKDDLIASVWAGRVVSDSTLDSRINAARKAIGDSGKEQRLIRTIARKGVRFVGAVDTQQGAAPPAPTAQPSLGYPRQNIRFCTASDGVRIAYAEVGQGPPLVKAANWLNHLEYDWQSPIWSHLLQRLGAEYRLVRYDERGNGLSDWDAEDISFEAFVHDLESVADATGLKRFPLLGISQGCAVSIAYAVRHPERVSHLILYGGFARGMRKRGSAEEIAMAEAMATMMLHGWGKENPAFRQLFTTRLVPGASSEEMQWMNDLQRMTTRPEMAVRLRHATNNIDVTGLLGQVRVPALVLHCRDDEAVPFEEGRLLAAGISGSRFVALEGRNHVLLERDSACARLLDEMRIFLRE
jgi:pimeloyl-ACP methyl ester carboxylesterase/DNA-binding winged helix-turn-helix (wHTH) protein